MNSKADSFYFERCFLIQPNSSFNLPGRTFDSKEGLAHLPSCYWYYDGTTIQLVRLTATLLNILIS